MMMGIEQKQKKEHSAIHRKECVIPSGESESGCALLSGEDETDECLHTVENEMPFFVDDSNFIASAKSFLWKEKKL